MTGLQVAPPHRARSNKSVPLAKPNHSTNTWSGFGHFTEDFYRLKQWRVTSSPLAVERFDFTRLGLQIRIFRRRRFPKLADHLPRSREAAVLQDPLHKILHLGDISVRKCSENGLQCLRPPCVVNKVA